MQENKLKAEKREIIGRKVKNLRKTGQIPANVYGKKIKSLAITLEEKDFEKIYSQAGETGIVSLSIKGEKEERPVLIQNVQLDPVSDIPLHIDLRQIILTEKILAKIPVELTGEPMAVSEKSGILIQVLSEIEVEALPTDLPEKFSVDVTVLKAVRDQVLVKDIPFGKEKKIEVKTDLNQVVAKIEPLAKEEVVSPPTPEAVVTEGEAAPTEGEKLPEETTAPTKDKPKEEKKE